MTTDQRKVQLEVEVDATKAREGFGGIKDGARDMAQSVAQSGREAANGVDAIGTGSDAAAQKLDRSTKNIIGSIQRATAAMEAGERGSASYWQSLAQQRGANADALRPYIDQLEAVRTATTAAEAAQRRFAEEKAFQSKLDEAAKLNKASEYIRFWEQSLEQAEAAEKRLAGQTHFLDGLQRQAEAIGKTRADLLEMQAAQMGVADRAAPFIARLRESEAGMKSMGVSAGQTAAALRMVPAQFTDIAVSLASGQQPLMVLLQQGGQLKDMFGGIGAAARAMGGYVLGLINPYTLAAAAAGALGLAFFKGRSEAEALAKSIIMSGHSVAATTGQLQAMAAQVAATTGATTGAATEALGQIVATGRVAADNLGKVTEAAVTLDRVGAQAVADTVSQFAELGKSPVDASIKLNEQYHYLTAEIYRQIKALEDQGHTAAAAALAQKTFADTAISRAKELTENLGYVEQAWNGIKTAAANAWDAIKGIGRENPLGQQIAQMEKHVADLRSAASNAVYGITRNAAQDALKEAETQLSILKTQLADQESKTAVAATADRKRESALAWERESDKYLTRRQQMEAEIVKVRARGAEAGASELEIEKRISAIREKYKSEVTATTPIDRADLKAITAGLESRIKLEDAAFAKEQALNQARQQAGLIAQSDYQDKLDALAEAHINARIQLEAGAETKLQALARARGLSAAERKNIDTESSSRRAAVDALKEELDLQRQIVGIRQQGKLNDLSAQYAKEAIALGQESDKLQEQIDALRSGADAAKDNAASKLAAQSANLGMAAAAYRAAEAEAVLAGRMADAEVYRATAEGLDLIASRTQALADKSRELAEALDAKQSLQAQIEIWKDLERTAHDTFVSIFDGNKDLWKRMRDAAKNVFFDWLYQMTAKRWIVEVGASFSNNPAQFAAAFGMGGGSIASDGGSAGGGGFGGFGNALSVGRDVYQIASGVGASSASLMAANAVGAAGGDALGTLIAANAGTWGVSSAGVSGMASMMGTIAAAAPYLAAVAALVAVADSVGAFKGPSYHSGAAVATNADDSQARLGHNARFGDTRVWGGFSETDAKGGSAFAPGLQTLGASVAGAIESTLRSFGSQAQVSVYSAFGADSKDASRGNLRVFDQAGSLLASNAGLQLRGAKYNKDASKGFQEFADDAGMVIRQALLASDIPGWAKGILSTIGADPGMAKLGEALSAIGALQTAAKNLAPSLKLSADAFVGITQAMGGLQAAQGTWDAYFQNFYSDQERQALGWQALGREFDKLNLAMPDSRAGFRALVEGLDTSTTAGQTLYAQLLGLAPAFAQVTEAGKDMGQTWLQLAADLKKFRDELTGGALAQLSPEAAYQATQAQFGQTSQLAALGNTEALGSLADVGRAFLEASKDYFASGSAYFADRDRVLASVDAGIALTDRKLTIPAFASGGDHLGGLRLVGERGPELEATGPARLFNAAQTQQILSGSTATGNPGRDAEIIRELQAVVRVLSAGLPAIEERLARLEAAGTETARQARISNDRRAA